MSVLTCGLFLTAPTSCSKTDSATDSNTANGAPVYTGETAFVKEEDKLTNDDDEKEGQDEHGRIWGTHTFATAQDAIKYMESSPDAGKYASGIFHRMADENLPYLTKLLNNPYDYFIVVDKQIMRVILFDKYGREVLGYGMACARNYGTKHKKADSRTPEGFFSAEGIYDSTDWLFTNDNGYTSPARGQFGPRFIRVKNPVTTQIGIHGTASPGSIGHRVSHGCIRVKNENILELVKYVTPGMPIIINPSTRDSQVNKNEGYHVSYITTDLTGQRREELEAQYEEEAKRYKEAAEKAAKERAEREKEKAREKKPAPADSVSSGNAAAESAATAPEPAVEPAQSSAEKTEGE